MSHRRIWIACLVVLLLALVPVATYAQDDQVRLFLPQMASSASSQEDGPLEEVTDPTDPSKQYRTREVKKVDVNDNSIVCDKKTEKETRKTPCYETKAIYDDWSEWQVDPNDPSQQVRKRTVKYEDVNYPGTYCDQKEEKETRKTPCYETKAIYDDWSEWEVDPNDPSKEFRTRKVDYEDVNYPGTICNSKEEREERPVEKPPVCEQTTPKYSEWSDWMVDPQDSSKEFRTRTVDHVDIYDESVVCKTETEREERPVDKPQVCEQTTEVIGDWSEWQPDPDNPAVEVRTRTIKLVDIHDESVVCDTEVQMEVRTVPSTLCEETKAIYGDWSEWTVDPNDPTKEFRTRQVDLVDVNDNSVVCDTSTETETRDVPSTPVCEETMLIEGNWSDWMDHPENPELQIRKRTNQLVDVNDNSVICDTEEETQTRPKPKIYIPIVVSPACEETMPQEGEWSEWQVDMTEALEFRTREIRFVDATNPDILCDVKVEREERQVSQRFVHASQDPHCNVGILAEGEEPRFIPFSEDESFDCAWPASEDAQTALKFALGKITYELSEYPGGGSIITEVKWVPVEGEEQVLTPREDKYLLGPVTIFVRHGDCSKKDCQDTLTFWPEHLQANGMLQEFFVAASSANAVVTK